MMYFQQLYFYIYNVYVVYVKPNGGFYNNADITLLKLGKTALQFIFAVTN